MADRTRLPKATHVGDVNIMGVSIPCANLDDHRRVITQEGLLRAIGWTGNPRTKQDDDDPFNLPVFLTAKSLQPFVSAELATSSRPVRFRRTKGGISVGYEARILGDICDVFLAARQAKALAPKQEPIAQKCELLLRGFARVGIDALIDEATGYQKDRDHQELQFLLEKYVTGDYAKWTKMFPDSYYQELARLRKWPYPFIGGARPGVIGHLTNTLIYEKLPTGVLEELRRVNPASGGRRPRKHHQHLTVDIGNVHLREHLLVVIGLMKGAETWKQFMQAFVRNFGGQLEIDLEFTEEVAPGLQAPDGEGDEDEKK